MTETKVVPVIFLKFIENLVRYLEFIFEEEEKCIQYIRKSPNVNVVVSVLNVVVL